MNMSLRILLKNVIPIVVMLAISPGCANEDEWNEFWGTGPKNQPAAGARTEETRIDVRDTIAPLVTVEGMRLNNVRGYGLVTDLVDTGGRDGPEIVKDYLFKEIERRQDPSRPNTRPAGDFLNSKDSAIVEITGWIPAGAEKGDRFDVFVKALGSEATSIVGGRLFIGELKLYAETPSGILSSATLATASGPVFVSPFNRKGKPTDKVDLTFGVVFGGGVVTEDRKIRLVLNDPSPSIAKRIEREINSRYGGLEKIAVGERTSHINLSVPREYKQRKAHFLNRILHTPLNSNVEYIARRSKELAQAFEEPEPFYDSIGIALDAIGKSAVPFIERLIASESEPVSYYASRTALRLGDRRGLDVVTRHARDPKSDFRNQAIDELGWATNQYGAGETLRELLDDADDEIRIAAYKALRRRPHPAIQTFYLDHDNVVLDVVDSKGPYLIYVRRTMEPRIAVFGRQMSVRGPAIFPGERNDGRRLLTRLTAESSDEHLTLLYHNKRNNVLSPKLKAPLNVAELIQYLCDSPRRLDNGEIHGLAVPYSEMVDILSSFCDLGSLQSRFVLEGLEDQPDSKSNDREESEY